MAKKITSAKERFTNAKAASTKAQAEAAEEQFVKNQNERARVGDFDADTAKQEHKENVAPLTDSLREQASNVTDEALKNKIDDVVATNDKTTNIVRGGDGDSFKVGSKVDIEDETTTAPKKENNNNKKYTKSMYGIIDALKNGDIDKGTAAYFMIDSLSKLARNTGRDIGNIGAQFSGGTIDNNYDESLWNARREDMFKNEITNETNTQEGTDKNLEYKAALEDLKAKGLSNKAAENALAVSDNFKRKADEVRETNPRTAAMLDILAATSAKGDIGWEAYAAALFANGFTQEEVDRAKDMATLFNNK